MKAQVRMKVEGYHFDLLKSEKKKVLRVAAKESGRTDCRLTTFYAKQSEAYGGQFVDCLCEICFSNGQRADFDVQCTVFMTDRRRSYAFCAPLHHLY